MAKKKSRASDVGSLGAAFHAGERLRKQLADAATPPQKAFLDDLKEGAAHRLLWDPLAGTAPGSLEREMAIVARDAHDPQGVKSAADVVRTDAEIERARFEASRLDARSLIEERDCMPNASLQVRQIIARGEDWGRYAGGRATVWALLRQAVEALPGIPEQWMSIGLSTHDQNILEAIVAEIIESSFWRNLANENQDLARCEPKTLLSELLFSFGLVEAPGVERWNSALQDELSGDLMRVSAASARLSKATINPIDEEELTAAREVLIEHVKQVRMLRRGPVQARGWRDLASKWNEAVLAASWGSLPLLCRRCGLPVLLRRWQRLSGGGQKRNEHCSEGCQKRDADSNYSDSPHGDRRDARRRIKKTRA